MSSGPTTSAMRETMQRQAKVLARLLTDTDAIAPVADRLRDRRVLVIGTGTSWHAAHQAVYLLGAAGLEVAAAQSADVAVDGPVPQRGDVLIALTHTGGTRFTREAVNRAASNGADVVQISGEGVADAHLVTVAPERSGTYTVSHLAALLRIAQLAEALGAEVGSLAAVPEAVDRAFSDRGPVVPVPRRLIEFIGGGINQWTASEGSLKIREAAQLASEGQAVEQYLHGPAFAMGESDALVCLDGGGSWSDRLAEVAEVAGRCGVHVTRIASSELGELLSIFPLTVAVQRIALESAETVGINPDTFAVAPDDVPCGQVWSAFLERF